MKKVLALFITIITISTSFATEGMWIPSLIDMFHSDMKTYGLNLSAEQIYSTNSSSLKDAVIQFNGGCTAEIVSDQGLILTNHHCGFDAIQKHSSLENDYLKNGFWAGSKQEELACPWLRVTFVKEIRDVTKDVFKGISDDMSDSEKNKIISKNIKALEKAENKGGSITAKIKPFSLGNEYFMLITEDFNDIRLVGAPPSAIGKYGGDTDNWVWPRHTGDFSVFRIYANGENKSAKHNEANVPFKPAHSLPVSVAPKQKGDFTMVYGFPGSTDQHYVSGKLAWIINKERPARIDMRNHSLNVIKPAMNADDLTRIQYSSKQARIANAWKKWIGQLKGLRELDALGKKRKFEEEYMAKAAERTEWKTKYYNVIGDLNKLQEEGGKYEFARSMFIEYFYVGPEFVKYSFEYYKLANSYEKLEAEGTLDKEVERLQSKSKGFYKNYNREVDHAIFNELTQLYIDYVDPELLPLGIKDTWQKQGDLIFEKSLIMNPEKMAAALEKSPKKAAKKLKKDPALKYATSIYMAFVNKVNAGYRAFADKEEKLMQTYVAGMLEMFPEKNFWADANSTMRITYGKIEGSAPYDGMKYTHYTTIDGIMRKHDESNPDFKLTSRFEELYEAKDFGNYMQDNELWVCFTASNHTTGGNSGSPVIDADGNLIGINFDRSWESTMSDFQFDERRCRNIAVDIRYVLWVIDKYGQAPHLVEEMNIIK
ncbi:MAG: peptidase [Crocinitomix sp. MedPE-SWsnd]|nr:MAG: peptidase [Crocinitomix sp. MedPE-SWsnd]